jgi:hypothetical protein
MSEAGAQGQGDMVASTPSFPRLVSDKTCLSLQKNVNFHQINVLIHSKRVFYTLSKLVKLEIVATPAR